MKKFNLLFICLVIGLFSSFLPSFALAASPEVVIKDDSYMAKFVSQSENEPISIIAGETKNLTIKFKNIGTSVWDSSKSNYISAYTMEPRNRISVFRGKNWISGKQTGKIIGKIKPNETGELKLDLKAPLKTGDYLEKFYLSSENNTWIKGGYFFLKIKVIEKKAVFVAEVNTNNNDLVTSTISSSSTGDVIVTSTVQEIESTTSSIVQEITTSTNFLSEEPIIRVGIWKPQNFVQFKSSDDDYNVYYGQNLVGILVKGDLGVFQYEDGQYYFRGSGIEIYSKNYFRLSPINNPHAVFSLLNFDHQVKWRGGSRNFNEYRGAMEYRLNKDGKTMYIVNELPFEDYVYGIAEASDSTPIEYIKALMVAARTYAYYIQQSTTKHDDRNFDVSGTTGDQLYLGYVNEIISPNLVEAVSSTRGQMVTYQNQVVITPYFGHSNGKTKAFNTVWGGPVKPWLVPVKTKYDKGLKQYGHGVGMSQRDAALRAEKENIDYVDLLKVYYTGIEIQKIY